MADAAAATQRRLLDALLEAPSDAAAAREALRRAMTEAGMPAGEDEAALRQMTSPWYRHFLALDPVPLLRAVKSPVLVVNGGRDVQVPAAAHDARLREALAGHPRAEIVLLAELNHLMQTARSGHVAEYGQIEETFAPAALQEIGEWIRRTAAVDPAR
jgi:fermentation-respiration switch protein FrsA (DUF1100 family)